MKILRKITSNSFFKNVASLMTGSGISQIIAIISIPILTSLYSPNEFGEYATYIAVISILAILASGRYELAIMLPKSRIDSIQIFYLTQIINIFFLILFSIVLVFIDLPHVIEEKQTNMKILICSSIFVLVLNQSLIYLANKFNYFSAMSLSRILNSFFTAIFSMLLYKYGINGMLLGFIIGNILSALNIVNKIGREFLFFKISYIIRLLKEYQDFPKKNILSALMNVCSTQVPVILITTFFGASISGYYTVALRF
ncbi:oligosaccharide flippase family protein [Planococcus koreensis]|uniref:oligosaccharide flippase family protein n=1 Tax=Planococcus koreensis TaxID=112331 RepID=UPI0039FC2A84